MDEVSLADGTINSPCTSDNQEFLDGLIRRVPICIAWTQPWAGDLGTSILYRTRTRDAKNISVGYFAYWTTERPWGNNSLTHWLLPALAVDAFYSHLLFMFPGIQRFMYGAGDVEGVRISYRVDDSNQLIPLSITADDGSHREVPISLTEAVDDQGRVTLLNDVWSHQLGGHQALALVRNNAVQRRCFIGESLRPLTDRVVSAFRLEALKTLGARVPPGGSK